MEYADPRPFDENQRSNWVRLRTLVVLRWIAITGQIAAIVIAGRYFGLSINMALCFLAVGAAVIANLIAVFIYPKNKRLTEKQVSMMLVFDITQLSALLYLTGGLHNPFALLILAPVAIAATVLRIGATITVGTVAIAFVTIVAWFHVPLRSVSGSIIKLPDIFAFGFWAAIVIGVVFLGVYTRRVASEMNSMSEALLATQMALAREQKIVDLAGVVAAAAHELGTPLATIKLASGELLDDLKDDENLHADALLIYEQVDRCRDILRSMGRAGKDDLHLRHAPLTEVLRESAEPHSDRGKTIVISPQGFKGDTGKPPEVLRRPEIIHGLRNLIQNAVDFSESTVWIDVNWTETHATVRIVDDGPGFSQGIIGRIGDPFVRNRRPTEKPPRQPEYEGMGLGLFIAKTLLERSGAELTFTNGRAKYSGRPERGQRTGAVVEVVWPLTRIGYDRNSIDFAFSENQSIAI